jgi:hypothetical protein
LLVEHNNFVNNFGGVMVYTDTDRYPDNTDQDSTCSIPLGALGQANSPLYYSQTTFLDTASDATIPSGSPGKVVAITSVAGTQKLCSNYGQRSSNNASNITSPQAPAVGMAVFNAGTGSLVGIVTSVSSSTSFKVSLKTNNTVTQTGAQLVLSDYGGCGPADYYGGGPGIATGKPSADYWDNCVWGARNITVSKNTFTMQANVVTGCTMASLCGYIGNVAFNAGVPKLMQFFNAYATLTAKANGGIGNVWSDNTYTWTNADAGAPASWQFMAGSQGNTITRTQWRSTPYDQDAGSTFNSEN